MCERVYGRQREKEKERVREERERESERREREREERREKRERTREREREQSLMYSVSRVLHLSSSTNQVCLYKNTTLEFLRRRMIKVKPQNFQSRW